MVSCIIFVNCLCKLQSNNIFRFILGYCLFYANDKATYQTCADGSPNTDFTRENNLKPISHPVEVVNAIFPVCKKKRWVPKNTFYSLYSRLSGVV